VTRTRSSPCIDLVTVTDGGLVARKDTFIDGPEFEQAFAT
jgi:hypothetical protein